MEYIIQNIDSVYIMMPKSINLSLKSAYLFDMDDTLIKTKSKNKFPQNCDDWQWKYDSIPNTLKKYAEDNIIVIMTNQMGVKSNKITIHDLSAKITNMANSLNIPLIAYIATRDDKYRKPQIGMWELFNGQFKINSQMFIGDAAGRVATNISKKDHSCSDRKFAANIGIKFATPEEFFQNESSMRYEMSPDPVQIYNSIKYNTMPTILPRTIQEMVILVGAQSTGKTTFVRENFPKYDYINADALGSINKCVKVAEIAAANKKSIIVDNTNPSIAARKIFIDIAKKYNIWVRVIEISTTRDLAEQLNALRTYFGGVKIPSIAYNIYYSKYQLPIEKEINEYLLIPFVPKFTEYELKQFLRWV